MKNSSKILIALGAGAAIGGLIGLLFAPDKGTTTRKKIRDAGEDLKDSFKEKMAKGQDKITSLKEDLKEKFNSFAQKEDFS